MLGAGYQQLQQQLQLPSRQSVMHGLSRLSDQGEQEPEAAVTCLNQGQRHQPRSQAVESTAFALRQPLPTLRLPRWLTGPSRCRYVIHHACLV